MIDVRNYSAEETLKNGTAVRIRCVRADDKKRISEAFRNLETESIYKRFFQYKKALTDEELKAATEVDFENEVALMVTRKSQLAFSIEEAPCSCTGFSRSGKKRPRPSSGPDAMWPLMPQALSATRRWRLR